MDLKESEILGDSISEHWYYQAKAKALHQFLGGQETTELLDVGAGSGFFSRHILDNTPTHRAICVDTAYASRSEEQYAGKKIVFEKYINKSSADLVLLMDVLEHVDDDIALLREYKDKVETGSRFLISVPAFQFLWSGHDDFLEHRRRYHLRMLERVVTESGLKVQKSRYYFGSILPLVALIRVMGRIFNKQNHPKSDLQQHHPAINLGLRMVCAMERPFMKYNRMAGLTLFCLAEKV